MVRIKPLSLPFQFKVPQAEKVEGLHVLKIPPAR